MGNTGNIGAPREYKKTEVGAIPVDWDVKAIEDVSEVKGGKRLPKGMALTSNPTLHPYITVSDMYMGGVCLDNIRYVPDEVFPAIKNYRIFKNDVFISVAGTLGLIGKIPEELDGANLTENSDRLTNIKCNRDYLLYVLMSSLIQKKIEDTRTLGAQPKLALTRIKKFQIPLPETIQEQQTIASALSEVDELINSMENLIAKKRDLKKATMQQLLTGKTRLPGFDKSKGQFKKSEFGLIPSDWEVFKLGELADPQDAYSLTGGPFGSNLKKSDYTDGGIRIIQLQNIGDGEFHNDYSIYTSKQKADELRSCNIYPGEIILSKMGDPVARACIVPPYECRYLMASDGIRLSVDKSRFDNRFVHDIINATEFRTNAMAISTGTTRLRIGLVELRTLPIPAPMLEEQKAISFVISNMDAEISALEQKRDKTKSIKQGMMQELLTGKTRLVKPEV